MGETIVNYHLFNFLPEIPGSVRFNASIIESGSGYILAFRNNWKGSRIYGAWLDADFKPTGKWAKIPFPLNHKVWKGEEDPRFFRHAGELWIAFVGFTGNATSVLYAKLNEETLAVEDFVFPQLFEREKYEKSWSSFSHGDEIHAIYSINPHVVMTFQVQEKGVDPLAVKTYQTPFTGKWSGGHMRGGASPVLHKGEWWHFFHGSQMVDERRVYNCGVVCFEDKPPFRITRYTPEPIDEARYETVPRIDGKDVLFPCGAVYRGGWWYVSYGINDLQIGIRRYSESWIEERLHAHR
jgi:predicted GH43/DUF377 family glycosyl hydrolase